jgi:glutamine synthetase
LPLWIFNVRIGFSDIIAKIDPTTYRRIPWERNTSFFLLDFYNPETGTPLDWCPRSLLKRVCQQLAKKGMKAYAGVEFEFYNFKGTPQVINCLETPQSLLEKKGVGLTPLTSGNVNIIYWSGMFCYSLTRPTMNEDYFYSIMENCQQFGIPIEGFHTESGTII